MSSLSVGQGNVSLSDKVDKVVQGAKTVHVDFDVFELFNVKVFESGLSVGTDGYAKANT